MTTERTSVLVVGAGLAGLSTAMFLAQRGVDVTVVEKHPGTSLHPKAAGQYPRTMQLMRVGGIDDAVLAASHGMAGGLVITIAETVRGRVYDTVHTGGGDVDVSAVTPHPTGMATQDKVEPIMLASAREHGAQVRFDTELVDLVQDDAGVDVRLLHRPTGRIAELHADYVVAAVGHRGGLRQQLGVARHGKGSLSSQVGVIFRADLRGIIPDQTGALYYLRNERFTGAFTGATDGDKHVFAVEYKPEQGESAADFDNERLVELIRFALDAPELEPDIVGVQSWEMAAWLSERFRVGRVFLAGDAAKVTPPTGGMGGNLAVQDGYDLAWKLAAVLRGEAGPGLLDSYEAERRPVADMVITTSLHNAKTRMFPWLDLSDVPAPQEVFGVMGAFRYRSATIVPDPDDDDPAPVENPFAPTGRPGFPAPHAVVDLPGASSVLDLFGPEWTLVAGHQDAAWRAAAQTVAAELGLTLRVYGAELPDAVAKRFGIDADGASLVRPDAMVAWRSTGAPADPAAALGAALRSVLDR